MDFIEACRKIIAFDSTPTAGNRPLVHWLGQVARERGLFVEIQEEIWNDCEQANILIRPQEKRPSVEFLLQTHLDTPDPGPFGFWTETGHNPFDAHIISGNIHGLGSADVKLDFLCKLEALSRMPDRVRWSLPPVLVGTFGEELGMAGALKLIRRNKINAKFALIGEPSNLQLISAGKGIATIEIKVSYSEEERHYRQEHNLRESTASQSKIFHGKSAHSSMPQLGESAVRKMLDYLLQLPENIILMEMDGGVNFNTVPANAFLEIDPVSGMKDPMTRKIGVIYRKLIAIEKEFQKFGDPTFTPPEPSWNIGFVRTFEDHLVMSGSCRLPPSVPNEVYESWMRQMTEACESVGASFRVTDYKRPYRTNTESMFMKGCLQELKQMQLPAEVMSLSSTNEASLWTRLGIECISFGAGLREGNIHTPQENVSINDLKKATDFYMRAMERFCR